MRAIRLVGGVLVAAGLAAALPWSLQGREVQTPQGPPRIPSLTEPGEGLTITQRSPRTGFVGFASSGGNGIRISVQENALPETRARSFIGLYGQEFGLSDNSQVTFQRAEGDALGLEHVRFQQSHLGVPVTGGEFIVHLRGSRVMAANGRVLDSLPPDVTPSISADEAVASAIAAVTKYYPDQSADALFSTPRLEIFNRGMLEDTTGLSRLVWFVEANGFALREYLWVDAQTGGVLFNFSQLNTAKNRNTYDGNDLATLPGSLVRNEASGNVGDADIDGAHNYAGDTYDYFFSNFSRDSYDGAGATMVSTVDHCPSPGNCPFANAFWNGTQMVYGDGYATADDVVGHELAHAVTENSANLFYYYQSGALNESFSDIFGESMDLGNGAGNDAAGVRWRLGEDLTPAGIRNMADPTTHGDPGKTSDPEFFCINNGWTSPVGDNGGVHINSGIPNHAYALMVDGGTYNGYTITGIGLVKAAAIQYRTLTTYLTSGATFLDNFNALLIACNDLIGTNGITIGDCTQVQNAIQAVEMQQTWDCVGATQPPTVCPNGSPFSSSLFFSDFESSPGSQWSFGASYWFTTGGGFFVADGAVAAYGVNLATTGTGALTKLAATAPLPANAFMYFDHAFEFENQVGTNWDGAVLEYSTNGGGAWSDAGSLIEAGQAYNGTINSGDTNPLGGRQGFTKTSFGFTGSRLNLTSLAGQSVMFRFLIGTDSVQASLGWFVDNVRIYTCGAADPEMVKNGNFSLDTNIDGLPDNWLKFAAPDVNAVVVNNTGQRLNFHRLASDQAVVFQQTGVPVPFGGVLQANFQVGNSDPVRKRLSLLIHDSNFSDIAYCTFWLEPSATIQSYAMRIRTGKAWNNATISFYASTVGNGGDYQLDNVSLQQQPGSFAPGTTCTDAEAPSPPGGLAGPNLIANGTFTGTTSPWLTFGNMVSQLTGGVFEYYRTSSGLPSPVIFQQTTTAISNDTLVTATFQLGNSAALRQRVVVLVQDSNFSDLHACAFWIPPGQPLSTYAITTYATKNWANASISFYLGSTASPATNGQWVRLDNVSLQTTPAAALAGTSCYEPGSVP